MSLISREALRDELVTKCKTLTGLSDETGGESHVFGYLTQTFNGLSPTVTIENGGWRASINDDESNLIPVRFVICFMSRISDDDRNESEDALDEFAGELTTMLSRYYLANYYDISTPFYEIIDGIDYRGEYHFVEIYR